MLFGSNETFLHKNISTLDLNSRSTNLLFVFRTYVFFKFNVLHGTFTTLDQTKIKQSLFTQ